MRYKRIKLIAILVFGLGQTYLYAQNLNVRENNGIETTYTLSNVQKITFPTGNMSVKKQTGSIDSYALTDIRYLNFNDLTSVTGISNETDRILTYPNPANSELHIQLNSITSQTISLEIMSIVGNVYYKQVKTEGAILTVNISDLSNGIYFCRIINGKTIQTAKFIKQ